MISSSKVKIEWYDFRCVKLCYKKTPAQKKNSTERTCKFTLWQQMALMSSPQSSPQILIHINPLPPIHYLYFSSYIRSIVNSDLLQYFLFVSVFCVFVLTAVYRLSNIATQIWGNYSDPVCVPFRKADRVFGAKTIWFWFMSDQAGHLSLSDAVMTPGGGGIFVCPSNEIHEYVTVSTV